MKNVCDTEKDRVKKSLHFHFDLGALRCISLPQTYWKEYENILKWQSDVCPLNRSYQAAD